MNNEELTGSLAALRTGDMAAFERIYSELKTPVYTVIVRVTRDEALSEDILQEIFVKLYRSPPAEDVRNPRAYIFRMARNLAIDGAKKRKPDVSLDDAEDMAATGEPDIPLRLDIEDALRSLDPTDRRIVTLHINGGLTFREVAGIEGMPLGTALWRYQRAVTRLRNILSGGAK